MALERVKVFSSAQAYLKLSQDEECICPEADAVSATVEEMNTWLSDSQLNIRILHRTACRFSKFIIFVFMYEVLR